MNKALEVLNEELNHVEYNLNNYKGQVEAYRRDLKEAEKKVAKCEKLRDELKNAIALIAADEN